MAEAGQEKALLVLDRHSGWEVVEELPLDLGPRHHILHAPAASELTELSSALRQGDRVLVVTDGDPNDLMETELAAAELKSHYAAPRCFFKGYRLCRRPL